MKLSLLAPIDEFTGYGKTANEIARRLPALLGCQMVIRATRATVPSPDIAPMVRGGENDCEWELICHPATLCPTAGKKTIYVTVGESTRLPPKSVAILNQCEAVITHSNYCAVSFSASGVNVPIYVVPLGFNPEVFNYRPMPEGPFTFGCAGKLRNGPTRKGVREVIRLFQAAFPIPAAGTIIGAKDHNGCRPDNVRLKVKIFPNDPALEVQDSRIEVVRAVLDEQTLANWMATCHCWVSLATGGFELMPLQAMALGRPVISFAFGGITEYLNRDNRFVVDHNLVPAGDIWKGQGLFAQANEDKVLTAMRQAADESNLQYVRDLGSRSMCSTFLFTWSVFASRMAETIQRVIPTGNEKVEIKHVHTLPGGSDVDNIIQFYKGQESARKIKLPNRQMDTVITTPEGLGDALILSGLPSEGLKAGRDIKIWAPFKGFPELSKFIPKYGPATYSLDRVIADVWQREFDMGNGHLIQRLQRAASLPHALKPMPVLEVAGILKPGRVAIHLEPGRHALWQRRNVHPKARCIYDHTAVGLKTFIKAHPEMDFVEIGSQQSIVVPGLRDMTGLPLGETIGLLKTCEYFLGIMSGPMHIATALGCKCVVIINFPDPRKIFLPTLMDIDQVESEWFYPQHTYLHQEGEGEQVKRFSVINLERAFQGELYPYWTDRYLELINETI